MRLSPDWFVLADERILEYIAEEGSGRPTAMADSGYVPFSQPYISERCQKLAKAGFLRPLGNGVYVITEKGEEYLSGDLDARDLTLDEDPSGKSEASA